MKVIIPKYLLQDPTVQEFWQYFQSLDVFIRTKNGPIEVNNLRAGDLTPDEVLLLMTIGVTVQGFYLYYQAPISEKATTVWEELPNRLDENGDPMTFEQWTENIVENLAASECIIGLGVVSEAQLATIIDRGVKLLDATAKNHLVLSSDWTDTPQELRVHKIRWEQYFLDYLQWREYLLQRYQDGVWADFTPEEKRVIAWNHSCPIDRIEEVLGTGTLFEKSRAYVDSNSKVARERRWNEIRQYLVTKIQQANSGWLSILRDDEYSYGLRADYVETGITGSVSKTIYYNTPGDTGSGIKNEEEGLYDYINATAGTTWAQGGGAPGIRAKLADGEFSGITQGQLDNVCDKAIDILRYGQSPAPFYIT